MKFLTSFIIFLSTIAPSISLACDPENDGDCCIKDSDCAAFFNPSLCAVVPLNEVVAKSLSSKTIETADFCEAQTVERLKSNAKSKIPMCLNGACEFKEDNG